MEESKIHEEISDYILKICDTYTKQVEQRQDKNCKKPDCFILPCIIGDKTDYFSETLMEQLKNRYGNINCCFLRNISEGEALEAFSSSFTKNIDSIKSGMARAIYPKYTVVYTPIIIMLSNKSMNDINEYIDSIINIVRNNYAIKMDLYFIVDEYNETILENKKIAIEKTKLYKENRNIDFGNIYFLGENTFVLLSKKLAMAAKTIEANIFYKATSKDNYNWQPLIEALDLRKKEYSGKGLEDLDCNWLSISYVKFDICEYLILYYLKEFIERQIGDKTQEGHNNEPTINEINDVEKEIDKYLNLKYSKENLIKNIKNIPIPISKLEYIKPEKVGLFAGLFGKKKLNNTSFKIDNLEGRLLDDKDYLDKYIEINADEEMEEFDLKSRIYSFNLVNKLSEILDILNIKSIQELNDMYNNLKLEQGFLNKNDFLSQYMEESNQKYFKKKIEYYLAKKKLKLIEAEISKNKNSKFTEILEYKEQKEKKLIILNQLMDMRTFNNENFKSRIDRAIEDNKKEDIFVDISWNTDFNEAVNNIGQDKFIDKLFDILNLIYSNDIEKIARDFESTMISDVVNSKYCIKYVNGFASGEEDSKPKAIINKTKMYCDYFEVMMSGSTSQIKCE